MPSFINTNLAALNIQRNLNTSQASQNSALQRLSSGMRINSAKDDSAGMAITNRMSSQISGANQAVRNANDGISLAQTAEGDLTQIANNLQRMRDLAVQSSNATNTASDRAALNSEVQALAQEIDRVSQSSSFNGVKLLDGSFLAQNFQVGANATANDNIEISAIGSARISQLGSAGTTTQTTVTGVVPTAALAAGDLTLNGQQVGVTNVGTLPGQSAASATAVAAAINAIAQSSGVTATANANTVKGTSSTVFGAGTGGTGTIAANTFSVNGISVGAIQGGGTAAGQGSNIAAAINAISNQTGVTAAADASSGALTLTAADGRDINIAMNGTSSSAGSAASKATFLTQTGLTTSTVGQQAYGAVSGTQLAATSTFVMAAATTSGGTIAANTLTANGVSVGAVNLATAVYAAATAAGAAASGSTLTIGNLSAGSTYTITSTATNAGTINLLATGVAATDAANFAAAYNALGTTQFTAGTGIDANKLTSSVGASTLAISAVRTAAQVASGLTAAQAAVTADAATATANGSGFTLSAGTLGLQSSGGIAYNGQQLATAIQTALTSSGSTATVSANTATGVITTATAAISIGLGGTAENAAAGLTNQTAAATATGLTAGQLGTQAVGGGAANHGSVTLHSTSASGVVIGGAATSKAGLTAGTNAATTVSSVSSISAIDITSASGASAALTAIDGALAMVNSSRASLGAYQNRFASVVTSLQTTSENLSASRSRIQDTDFASETGMLSRAQILQQAGTAMLAQANQMPNQVMSLLR